MRLSNEFQPITEKELSKLIDLRGELAAQYHHSPDNRALLSNTMFAIDELVGLIDRIRHMIYDQRHIIETDKERSCFRNDEFIAGKEKIILELIRACNMSDIIR